MHALTHCRWRLSSHNGSSRRQCTTTRVHCTPTPFEPNAITYHKQASLFCSQSEAESHCCTLVTQCSLDRWARFAQQAKSWGGPVSVAVYIPAPRNSAAADVCVQLAAQLAQELEQVNSHQPLRVSVLFANTFVREGVAALKQQGVAQDRDIHPLLEPAALYSPTYDELYPINALRNLALHQAATPLVLLADADFIFSRDLEHSLQQQWVQQTLQLSQQQQEQLQGPPQPWPQQLLHNSELQQQQPGELAPHQRSQGSHHEQQQQQLQQHQNPIKQAPVMLVLPVFQLSLADTLPDSQAAVVPRTKPELAAALAAGTVEPFHCGAFPPQQQPVDINTWLHANLVYEVPYCEYFEPQGIAVKGQLPLYDESFRGYGLNKVQHAWHMAQLGYKFMVLPDAFMVTAPHQRSSSWRPTPGTASDTAHLDRIKQVYEQFKHKLAQQLAKAI